jgi:hypothetical protein
MKSCGRESFKTCSTSSSLISILSNSNKWKVQTYFYVTISILVNSYILGMLFDNFTINARTQNPRQWETMSKTEISYHRHILNECQTYPHISQDVQALALKWPDYYLPGHVWKCRHNLIRSLKYLPIFLSVETQKCLQCDTNNARTTTIQARDLNVLFLFEQYFISFEGVQICTKETTTKNFVVQSHAKKLHKIFKGKWSESSLWMCMCELYWIGCGWCPVAEFCDKGENPSGSSDDKEFPQQIKGRLFTLLVRCCSDRGTRYSHTYVIVVRSCETLTSTQVNGWPDYHTTRLYFGVSSK